MVDEWVAGLDSVRRAVVLLSFLRSWGDKIQKIHNNLRIPIWVAARGGIPKDLKTFGLSNEPRGSGLSLGPFSLPLSLPLSGP